MSNANQLSGANILTRIEAADKTALFKQLVDKAIELPQLKGQKAAILLDAVRQREHQAPTTLGNGVILPHARIAGLQELAVVIATLRTPLECETPDRKPIRIACLLLIPDDQPMRGLKFIAHFAAYARMPHLLEPLLRARQPEEIVERLSRLNIDYQQAVIAGDIMAPCRHWAMPDLPLRQVTGLMAHWHLEVLPVLDNKHVVGELACTELFKLGIPDFFSQLKSVGFIRFFDPFEKYFSVEADAKTGDVMSSRICLYPPDATLIEVVFAISVLKYHQIYVVDRQDELLGIIDQALLLERIISL